MVLAIVTHAAQGWSRVPTRLAGRGGLSPASLDFGEEECQGGTFSPPQPGCAKAALGASGKEEKPTPLPIPAQPTHLLAASA